MTLDFKLQPMFQSLFLVESAVTIVNEKAERSSHPFGVILTYTNGTPREGTIIKVEKKRLKHKKGVIKVTKDVNNFTPIKINNREMESKNSNGKTF